jgi:hypothetical protein
VRPWAQLAVELEQLATVTVRASTATATSPIPRRPSLALPVVIPDLPARPDTGHDPAVYAGLPPGPGFPGGKRPPGGPSRDGPPC